MTQLLVHKTDGGAVYVTDNHDFAEAKFIIRIDSFRNRDAEANAAFIVRAVNNHEALVAALESIEANFEEAYERNPLTAPNWLHARINLNRQMARAALANAKKEVAA